MTRPDITAEIASALLRDQGVAMIWELHLAAAELWQIGHGAQAASLVDIADTAERQLRHRINAGNNPRY